ncbi:type III-D CRISPR-associated protein Csx19 [Nocardia fluminea]|uniref:CRISPR-associated protein (TIGR03984 family) n=1 Tax=Nocardia fluminea TaxID=134984 RepID=A0A2N3WYC6_9NOCA|nr:CRISPR-associated protein Csx19 [Nocardia fluminea]PKV98901.1 CRISPR-associated protein (TIGR03984 family) [Nocardia fluminea]
MTEQHSSATYLAVTQVQDTPTAAQALAAFADYTDLAAAIAFTYTPTAAPWLRCTDGHWHTHTGTGLPADVFELRAFTPEAELRWWRDPHSDTGTAVVLTETVAPPQSTPSARLEQHERSLLLWGSAATTTEDWTNLADPRIGDILWVPLSGTVIGSVVRLHFAEYATVDTHGNLAVTDQRLTHLTHTPPSDIGEHA